MEYFAPVMSGKRLAKEEFEKFGVELKNFRKTREYLVAIDTDGCVVDNMNGKQILVFHPLYMEFYDLWDIESYFRETAEYYNLFSIYRGSNRFIALKHTLEALKTRKDSSRYIMEHKAVIPDFRVVDRFIQFCNTNGYGLSNFSLEKYFITNVFNFEICKLLGWSRAVNEILPEVNKKFEPFENARKCLEMISSYADIVVVSQTPYNDLFEYWRYYDMLKYVKFISGQETGSKTVQIKMLKDAGNYPSQNIMMIGDSYGDFESAKNNGVSFYPVIPGSEEKSWENFPESFELFLSGKYICEKQNEIIEEFLRCLPDLPPWEKPGYNHIEAYRERQNLRISLYEKFNKEGRLLLV